MTEDGRHFRAPQLFEPIPKDLTKYEREIKARYDGTIDRYGVVVVLDRASGALLFATLTDLYDKEGRRSYQPTDRGKWSFESSKRHYGRDITPQDSMYGKLNAIEDHVRDRWRETPLPERTPGQFKTHVLVKDKYMLENPAYFGRKKKPRKHKKSKHAK